MNESASLRDAISEALDALGATGPRPLISRVNFNLEESRAGFSADEVLIADEVLAADVNDLTRKKFHFALLRWDAELDAAWVVGTERYSDERRSLVLETLGFSEDSHRQINEMWPPARNRDIVISSDWDPWYSGDRPTDRAFYWPHYRDLLRSKGWGEESLGDLDAGTSDVVRRLSDPLRVEAYQSKGLVVGYVQSGKTAHFTGTIAKAIDAGYRLVIVLAGTLDLLRNQTQRRLDMELVGVPGILGGKDTNDPELDYQEDNDWLNGRFVTHGGVLPSSAGYPDIRRLTTAKFDFQRLKGGLDALDIRAELRDKSRPIFSRDNLFSVDARLIVVKKIPPVLKRLVKDLQAVTANLSDIPTLIIDDESDQASVSTVNPAKQADRAEDEKLRTATNGEITKLLHLLPRAQYVGYTATPFANVFVDPDDSQDIFPKDFVISLQRPGGYMGASDFHDFDDLPPGEIRTVANSNQLAHVRDLVALSSDDDSELQQAIDSYVLSGALKLYRAEHDPKLTFRHHTMLIHESTVQKEHLALAEKVERIWNESGFDTAAGLERLTALWTKDFRPVSQARAVDLPLPSEFSDLVAFVGPVLARTTRMGSPVLVVNGDKDLERYRGELDFDTTEVWRLLVGGTKLSRGFTVEGLTVSYYKRRSLQADTLMQMGRWFGFRPGYEDLVRLYIDRASPTRARTFDLYEAFESMVLDEESFREELRRYAELSADGKPVVTPREIPPLVTQHLPWLQPTSRNKRYNAVLVERGDGGQVKDLALLPVRGDGSANRQNFEALKPILEASLDEVTFLSDFGSPFKADVSLCSNAQLVQALEAMIFDPTFDRGPQVNFLRKAGSEGLITDWVVIRPLLDSAEVLELEGIGRLGVVQRNRRTDASRVGFSGSSARQRPALRRIAGVVDPRVDDAQASNLFTPTRGSVLITAIADPFGQTPQDVGDIALLVSYVAPLRSAPRGKLGFTTVSKTSPDAIFVSLKDDD